MNNIPAITKNLLIINILAFFATIAAEGYNVDLVRYLGLHYPLSGNFNISQLFTYMFLHGGFTHLFFNMFALWMFGRILEQMWGPKRFLTYYLVCGIGAGLINILVTYFRIQAAKSGMDAEIVARIFSEGTKVMNDGMYYTNIGMNSLNILINHSTIGASGAVYGILLGFGMIFPNEKMFIFPLPVPIKAKFFVVGYALIELYSGFANNPHDNVAHFAHLGGMIFGIIMILYWRKKDRQNGNYYY